MNTDEKLEAWPFPAADLKHFARCLVNDGRGDAYRRFRAECDAAILAVEPAIPQHRFARLLGLSRTTLRCMLARLNLTRADGRKAVTS